jgi:hypothetical protein
MGLIGRGRGGDKCSCSSRRRGRDARARAAAGRIGPGRAVGTRRDASGGRLDALIGRAAALHEAPSRRAGKQLNASLALRAGAASGRTLGRASGVDAAASSSQQQPAAVVCCPTPYRWRPWHMAAGAWAPSPGAKEAATGPDRA